MDVDDGRHFLNTMLDTVDALDAHSLQLIHKHLETFAEKCSAKQSSEAPSIYTGDCGAAVMFLKLAITKETGDPQALLSKAYDHAQRCVPSFKSTRVATFLEGLAGAISVKAVVLHLLSQHAKAKQCCEEVLKLSPKVGAMSEMDCELLYGRCGYLHCILFLRKYFEDPNLGTDEAALILNQVIQEGLENANEDLPMFYEWHHKCYLGAAHGLCGILFTLLHFIPELQALPNGNEVLSKIKATVDALLKLQFSSGNMPSSLGSDRDKLVHWCHGAPGYIPLLLRCAEVFNEPLYLQKAKELGDVVWLRGLLQKGVGLCHGISGNGYMQLSLFRVTQEVKYLHRAQQFLLFSIQNIQQLAHVPDHPYSLFEGLMGSVCFGADVLHPDQSFFPGYEV